MESLGTRAIYLFERFLLSLEHFHSLGDDAVNLETYFPGVRMRLAGSFSETEVENMLPLGNGIGIGYHRIGI